MRLIAALEGNLREYMNAEIRGAETAVTTSVREASGGLKDSWRGQVRRAGLSDRLGRTIRDRFYANEKINAAGLVFTRAPEIISAFEFGAFIRARNGRFLAIPTNFNRQGGWRAGQPRVSPQEMIRSRMAFVRPRPEGGFYWMLQVTRAQGKTRGGSIREQAYAGGMVRVGTGKGGFRSGRWVGRRSARQVLRDILDSGAVPMFTLIPNTRVTKRLDLARDANRWADRLGELVVRNWPDDAPGAPR